MKKNMRQYAISNNVMESGNGASLKGLKGLAAIMLMCMCILTVSVKAQVNSVSTDKNSYPKGETISKNFINR